MQGLGLPGWALDLPHSVGCSTPTIKITKINEMVLEATNMDACFYFVENHTFNNFLEGKPLRQPGKAKLIIAFCTEAPARRKASPFCSQELESCREHTHLLPQGAEGIVGKCCGFSLSTCCFDHPKPSGLAPLQPQDWDGKRAWMWGTTVPLPATLSPKGLAQREPAWAWQGWTQPTWSPVMSRN